MAPKTIRPRRRGHDVDEQQASPLARVRALGPHQLLGVRGRLALELLVAQRALRRAVGADQQLAAALAPGITVTSAPRPRCARGLLEVGLQVPSAHGS